MQPIKSLPHTKLTNQRYANANYDVKGYAIMRYAKLGIKKGQQLSSTLTQLYKEKPYDTTPYHSI